MSLHSVPQEEKCMIPFAISSGYTTVSGTEGSRIGMWVTRWSGTLTGGVGRTVEDVCTGTASVVWSHEYYGEYNPEIVGRLLRLDALWPEAKFNNVIDMMDWLNSD